MSGLEIGKPTGRTFIYDDANGCLTKAEPNHDEWHRWEEYRDDDGDLWYVSDHEEYTLGAEEFGPIEYACYLCGKPVDGDRPVEVCDQHH